MHVGVFVNMWVCVSVWVNEEGERGMARQRQRREVVRGFSIVSINWLCLKS